MAGEMESSKVFPNLTIDSSIRVPKQFEEYSQPKAVPVNEQSSIATNEKLAFMDGEFLNIKTQRQQALQTDKSIKVPEMSNQGKIAVAAEQINLLPKEQQLSAFVRLEEIAAKLNVPVVMPKNELAQELQHNA